MTPLLIGAASGGVAVLLAGVGWWRWRHTAPRRIDSPEDAAAAAEALGLRITGAVVGADGAAALAVTDDGRVAAIARRGRGLVAREVAWQAVQSTAKGVLVETGDARLGVVRLAGVDALDIRRLAPQARRS